MKNKKFWFFKILERLKFYKKFFRSFFQLFLRSQETGEFLIFD